MRLEIATQDVEGVRVAQARGADRVELCQALPVGGLTPSQGLVEQAVALGVPVRALIRPRAGGYRYTATETATMVRDVATAVAAGAEGVVVGALTDDGLDRAVLRALVHAAAGAPVIVHRCVDVLLGQGWVAPAALVAQLLELGVAGMLTSGGAERAPDGRDTIAALAAAAAGRLEIVAGGGVRPEHFAALARAGADTVHLSAGRAVSAGPSGPGGGEDEFVTTDPAVVAAARAAVDALT
ncbi:copper homeostasis protein CutC [Natronosporangium hydrolyticum]|uniref:PF03932 family protein CutC n=1 Tax=Natronosporangium hydrolyticum TaxID=2811111 RepID=A0A895YGD9_9ACTN|nr:copper homeostasis protein CutC [Natronosporangium hydrolyticum]QSB16631.1 copper homeostasis protein CutC [Natronosporangium hydrolyticum]